MLPHRTEGWQGERWCTLGQGAAEGEAAWPRNGRKHLPDPQTLPGTFWAHSPQPDKMADKMAESTAQAQEGPLAPGKGRGCTCVFTVVRLPPVYQRPPSRNQQKEVRKRSAADLAQRAQGEPLLRGRRGPSFLKTKLQQNVKSPLDHPFSSSFL